MIFSHVFLLLFYSLLCRYESSEHRLPTLASFREDRELKQVANGFTINAEEFPLMNRWVKLIAEVPAVKGTIIPARIHLERWKNMDAGVYYYDLPE